MVVEKTAVTNAIQLSLFMGAFRNISFRSSERNRLRFKFGIAATAPRVRPK